MWNTARHGGFRIIGLTQGTQGGAWYNETILDEWRRLLGTQGRAWYNATRHNRALVTLFGGGSLSTNAREDKFERGAQVECQTLPYHDSPDHIS